MPESFLHFEVVAVNRLGLVQGVIMFNINWEKHCDPVCCLSLEFQELHGDTGVDLMVSIRIFKHYIVPEHKQCC